MKQIFYLITAILILSSCSEEQFDRDQSPYLGDKVNVSLSFGIVPEEDETGKEIISTRAPELSDAEEDEIHNVWVFQFDQLPDGADDTARPLIWSYYLDEAAMASGTVKTPLIDSGDKEHLLVFVANTNNKSYSWDMKPGVSTYADLLERHIKLSDEEAITYGNDKRNLLMSGSKKAIITKNATLSGIELMRNLAKIQLNLSVGAADYKVLSIQLRNASRILELAGALKDYDPQTIEPFIPDVTHYPILEDTDNGLVDQSSGTKSFFWYVARNVRGVTSNTDAKEKNRYAPEFATFIEITAINTNNSNEGVVYRIYPGADNTSDFSVVPNRKYTIDLKVTGNGGETLTDSRIEQFKNTVRFPGDSNSFILNPPTTQTMGSRTFEIPITRVNEYWSPQNQPGYGGFNNDLILSNTNWKVELLWQDDPDIIRDQTDAGKLATHITLDKSTGTGPNDVFSVTVPYGAKHGNFVVAIYEASDADKVVRWSWHFWVTDYNPDQRKFIEPKGDQFVYEVPGGHVERYGGTVWGYDTAGSTAANYWNNYTYNPSSTQPYARQFMMDRAMGALSNNTNPTSGRGNFHYQYGRKDPFPGVISLYKIDGTKIATQAEDFKVQYWNETNANATAIGGNFENMRDLVRNPLTFYLGSIKDLKENSYLWHDSKIPKSDVTAKSVFDPCPPGWHVPSLGVWNDFRANITMGQGSKILRDFISYLGGGFYYWPYIEKDGEYPVQNKIYYPYLGNRVGETGHCNMGTVHMRYVYSVPHNATRSYSLANNNADSFLLQWNLLKTEGGTVRCISQ